jgi:YD repeat-containing protein
MKKYCLLIIATFISIYLKSQDLDKFHEVIPPSPTVAALMKFTDIPVSYNTGIPNITVPIWTMKGKQLNLPISLSYHASGIKVNQMASWVGLGWALNAGGSIARIKKGNFDEHPQEGYWKTIENYNGSRSGDNFNETWIDDNKFELLLKGLDTEPDIFSFNFMGYSGHFVIDADFTGAPTEQNVHTIPYMDLKITPIINDDRISGFEIVSPDGTIYRFGGILATEYTQVYYTLSADDGYNSAWHLTEVVSPNKERLVLEYSNDNFDSHGSYSFSQYTILGSGDMHWWVNNGFEPEVKTSSSMQHGLTKKLNKITLFSREDNLIESVEFGADKDRLDLANCLKLNRITISDANNNLLKSFAFDYSYFHSGGPESRNYRLRLDSLIEEGQNNKKLPPYLFDYYLDDLPPINSLEQDLYGFYNAQSNPHLVPGGFFDERYLSGANREPNPAVVSNALLKEITYPTGGSTRFTYEMNDYHSATEYQLDTLKAFADHPGTFDETVVATREIYTTHPQHILIKLNLPNDYFYFRLTNLTTNQTGGFLCKETTETLFELNEGDHYRFELISFYTDDDNPSGLYCPIEEVKLLQDVIDDPPAYFSIIYELNEISSKRQIGGARIKQIDYYTDKLVKSKQYNYTDPTTGYSSGVLYNNKPVFHYYIEHLKFENMGPYQLPGPHTASFLVRSSNNLSSPVLGINPHVVYKNVSVVDIKYNEQFNIAGNNGKTEYQYNYNIENAAGTYPYGGIKNSEWKYGNMTKFSQLNSSGDTTNYTISEYQEQSFDSPKFFQLLGFKLAWEKRFLGEFEQDYYSVDGITYDKVVHKTYAINTNVLNKITENNAQFDLSTNQKVTSSNKLKYDIQYNFVKKQTQYLSNGDSIRTYFYYPFDVPYPDDVTAPFDDMVSRNIIQTPLKTETYRNLKKISGVSIDYRYSDSLILPSIQKVLEGESYKEKMIYSLFDVQGNLLWYHKLDGVNTSIYWGYNKRYPVAKIIGASYPQISSYQTLFDELDDTEDLNSTNALIREALKDFQVTTYTYKESVGIETQTDPNGKTTYYEYDDFGRLKLIRDHDRNIIKKYAYEYQAGSNLPTGFGVDYRGMYRIDLKWDTNSEIDEFNLYQIVDDSRSLLYSGDLTSFSHEDLTSATEYSYQLTAVKNGLESGEVALTVNTKKLPPGTPILILSCLSSSEISLDWGSLTGETGFRVYRGASSSSVNEKIADLPMNTITYTDSELTPGTTYYYKIEAFNEDHNNEVFSDIQSITTAPPIPGGISGDTSPCINSNQTYKVTPVAGATYYEWDIPSDWTIVSGENTTIITVTVTNSLGDIKVRGGNESGTSDYSSLQIIPIGEPVVLIGGPDEVAQNAAYNFSVLSNANSSSFQWNFPEGCLITNGEGTDNVTVNWGTVAGVVNVDYLTDGCNSHGEKTVNLLPDLSEPNLIASCLNSSSALLSWDDLELASGYRIYEGTVNSTVIETLPAGTTSTTIEGLTPGITYGFRVEAYNDYDQSMSTLKSISTISNISSLNATAISSSRIDISWSSVSGATGYEIKCGAQPAFTVNANITSYSFTGLNSNTNYTISVKATNYSSCESANKTANCTTKMAPPALTNLSLSCTSSSAINLNWTSVAGAVNYKIYRGTSSSNVSTLVADVSSNTTSYTNSVPSPGTRYYYKIETHNANNFSTSNTKNIITIPAKPGTISGNTSPCISSTQLYSVRAIGGASTYQWLVPQGWTIISGQGTRTLTVKVSSTYGNIQVRAGNSSGFSSYSSKQISPQGKPTVQIGGPIEVDANSVNGFSVLSSANSSQFVWTVSSGCTIISGQGTDNVSVRWGTTSGEISITYKTGACTTNGQKTVTVNTSGGERPPRELKGF